MRGKPGLSAFLLAGTLSLLSPARANDLAPPAPSLRLYDRNGILLRTLLSEKDALCFPVGLDTISPWVLLATLAAEDKRFFLHPGVDFKAAARALWQGAKARRVVSGASTLTEQLVHSLDPAPRSIGGKLREWMGALRLERKTGKREILEAYLNHIPYGNLCQGIEAASRTYFGIPSRDLSLAQAVLLAGLPKSPTRLDPFRNPRGALERQRLILERMARKGWVDGETHRSAMAEPISFQAPPKGFLAPHFTEHLRRTLPPGRVEARGSLDLSLQADLEPLLTTHLRSLKGQNVTNACLVVLENPTGEVLAWIGSADFFDPRTQGQVDGVLAKRQPGSSLKPFLYTLAFSEGKGPSDILQDEPTFSAGGFVPKNYDESYHGPVRMRTALACSYNIPAIRLAEELTVPKVLDNLHGFGFKSLDASADRYGVGLVLGNGEVTLLELAAAYACLARGGLYLPSLTVPGGRAEGQRVMDRGSCYLTTSILSDNAARSPAFGLYSPLLLPFPFAAKTGTTKDYRDNWAVGYTPRWTIAVWAGNFDGSPMRKVSGITGAAPILHDAAMAVERLYPSGPFRRPAEVTEVEICPDSGKLPGFHCPNRMVEVFRKAYLPSATCDVHRGRGETAAPDRPSRALIAFPKEGDVFKIDPSAPAKAQGLVFRTNGAAVKGKTVWRLDGKALKGRAGGTAWWDLAPGEHRLELTVWRRERTQVLDQVLFKVLP